MKNKIFPTCLQQFIPENSAICHACGVFGAERVKLQLYKMYN